MAMTTRERLAGEELMSMTVAGRRSVGRVGGGVPASTVRRWVETGVKGADGRRVTLEAYREGGRWLTSAEALERFHAAVNGGRPADLPRRPTARQRRVLLEKAEAEARAMGI